jgi:hypothetical protein
MTHEEDLAFTVFRFSCQHCGQANEYLHRHRAAALPHLISTSCRHCRTLNQLGGLTGSRLEPPSDRDGAVSTSRNNP